MSEGKGRARGRGGRGRNPPPQAPPGTAPPSIAPVQQVPQKGPTSDGRSRGGLQAGDNSSVQPNEVMGGRGVQRGGGRISQSGGGDSEISMKMGELDMKGRPEYVRREPYARYQEKRYKLEAKPSVGGAGTRSMVKANYFGVDLAPDMKIYQYHVDFKPPIENIRVKFALIAQAAEAVGSQKLFDGGILYLSRVLPKDPYVTYSQRKYDDAKIEVTFTRKCEVLHTSPQFLQIANILMKKVQVALDMKQIRDHYYNADQTIKISKHKLEVMPGFTTAISKFDGGNLLGVDIIHKILRMDTFLDAMYQMYEQMQNSGKSAEFQDAVYKNFVGSIVLTRYNNKTYKVDDIAWDMRPTDTFEKGGEKISYKQYYKDHWGLDVRDDQQPLLVSRPTEKDRRRGDTGNLYLCPELCTITGLSDQVRSDFRVMQDLAVHTRIDPQQRVATLEKFTNLINSNPKAQEVLKPWNMRISKQVQDVPARELPAEFLLMKGQRGGNQEKITYDIKQADWSRNMRNCCLLNPVHLGNWVMIYPSRCAQVSMDLADCLSRVGQGMGMKIAKPISIELNNDRNESYLQAIRSNLCPETQMVMTVLTNNKKDRYDAIKKSCCIDNPVPSQCVLQKTISKQQGLISVATKIAIQLNCKMGGEVWGAVIPVSGMMIIGLDTYHDSANKNQSVGAMVASLNKEATRYYCKTEYHDKKSEIMQNLNVLVTGALRKYHEVNQCNPSKVIVYRDGVGDGQLDVVFNSEKEQMEQAFMSAGGSDFKPNFAMIIVKKRINTRFFKPGGGKLINPYPGTIIDQGVTKQEWYDFFLVSQSVRQGTVSPTSYNVIFDESGLKPDHLQMLTYKLTHLYFNWQGTIRVPAPCQYAHKLAFLQGQSLHREFSAHLSDKLFFL